MIPRSVLASVSASVDYFVPLNKGTLTKLSLIASGVICTENSSEYEIMKEYMQVQTTEGYSVMIIGLQPTKMRAELDSSTVLKPSS